MAEKNEDKGAVEIDLDAQTFDLGAWVQKNHTYPSYQATVHMDKESVARSNEALAEIKKIDKQLPGLRKRAEEVVNSDGSIGETSGPRAAYNTAVSDRRKHMKIYNAYCAKAKGSALTITFRAKDEDAQKRVRDRMEELIPGFIEMSDEQIREALGDQELANSQQAMLFLELAEDIVNAQGQHVDHTKLNTDKVIAMFRRISSRDSMRVANNMNLAMTAAELVEEDIDAGFLG